VSFGPVREVTAADLHAAAVARALAEPPRPCLRCDAELHTVALPDDTFGVADAAGSVVGTDPALLHFYDPERNPYGAASPYDALRRMAALMEEARQVRHAGLTWVYWNTARGYSMLKGRLDDGLPFHEHKVLSKWDWTADPRPPSPDVPEHCGMPAWLRPSAWYCRVCKARLTDAVLSHA
jgi:hypothetical protein